MDGGVDWADVRQAYERNEESVAAIQRRFGLTARELRQRRESEGWTPRAPVAKRAISPATSNKTVDLEQRLTSLVAAGVDSLTKQFAKEELNIGTARVLTELCRAADIMKRSQRMQKSGRAREKKNNDAGHDFRDDPEWLLAEINRRLDRLGKHAASQAAGDPAGGTEEEGAAGA